MNLKIIDLLQQGPDDDSQESKQVGVSAIN